MSTTPTIVWFRRDLRLSDQPALAAAAAIGAPVLPLFILDETSPGIRPLGGAQRWWLHHSLESLAGDLARRGLPLILRRGPAIEVLAALVAETGAGALVWSRGYEAPVVRRDGAIKSWAADRGLAARSVNGTLLAEPWTLTTRSGGWFKVFTPFWRALDSRPIDPPLGPPQLAAPVAVPASDRLADWGLLPTAPDWAGGLRTAWTPGEAAAAARLAAFVEDGMAGYPARRDRPDQDGTARLSPHLQWGEISPRQVWHAAAALAARAPAAAAGADAVRRQLAWREFYHHLLFHQPSLPSQPVRPEFAAFPWNDDPRALAAWQRGRTGFPLVDAGLRQLWQTGWMHNRVRMLAGSVLVKHLLQPWQSGEAWFWDTLVDADAASNAGNWQWVAGCGTDAAPYFRIFSPVRQGEQFDPAGDYVRRWVPELAGLPPAVIHRPWTVDGPHRRRYPDPIVDHAEARSRALAAYAELRAPAMAGEVP